MKLHLGCGNRLLKDWMNVDLETPTVDTPGATFCRANLSREIPFGNTTADFIYTEHFIEHLTYSEGLVFLKECHRVLKPDGVIRISTPDLWTLLKAYRLFGQQFFDGNTGEWRPHSPCAMVNEGMRHWGHQWIYDQSELADSLKKSGFTNLTAVPYQKSAHSPELNSLESRPDFQDLIVEATR